MYILYNILIALIGILALPYLLVKVLTDTRYRSGLCDRLGYVCIHKKQKRRIMVHASSVGEVNVAYPFIRKLKDRYGDIEIVLTVMTPEGYSTAKKKLDGLGEVRYFPIDCSFSVFRFLNRLDPDYVFIMETEIWPNFLRSLKRRGITSCIINGRISERSFARYMRINGFIAKVLKNIDLFLMQEEEYKERLMHFIDDGDNVSVTGSIKFDIDDTFFKIDDGLLKVVGGIDYIVAASTHDNEEQTVLEIFKSVKEKYPEIKLAIAPRHINRCPAVEALIRDSGFSYVKRTELGGGKGVAEYDVILIDTIGDLVTLISSARLVFMGGSLVNIGGHNILEPAYFAKPAIFGPHMQNFSDASDLLLSGGGAVQVKDGNELREKIIELLGDDDDLTRIGQSAKSALDKNKGALESTMAEIAKHLKAWSVESSEA